MTLSEFKLVPWQNSHEAYKESALAISPAPEYANSEVLVASLYRTIGFGETSESSVPQAGKNLDKVIQRYRNKNQPRPGATVDADTWYTVLHGVLESPKLPNQSSKRFLQVSPLVPGIAPFSGSARLGGNSWHAGSLVRRMVWLGSVDENAASLLWQDLFLALDVTDGDDVFARWLQQETGAWAEKNSSTWGLQKPSPKEVANMSPTDMQHVQFPAKRFVQDLRSIIQSKDSMTRRQWTSLLEAIIRLAAAAHVLWLCDVQTKIWACVESAIDGSGPQEEHEVRAYIFPFQFPYMSYGDKALPGIKDRVSGYLLSRLGLNAVLWSLGASGAKFEEDLSSSRGIAALCKLIRENREVLVKAGIRETIIELNEREARTLRCRKGIGSNLLEFTRHVLGQRQTANGILRGYDQGYVLKKKGLSSSSPWIVCLGPVSVLAIVHCALAGMGGPRSIHRLSQHLSAYGIVIDRHDIASNDLGHQLRMLGLVLDSPDAESGMLLLPPFPASNLAARTTI